MVHRIAIVAALAITIVLATAASADINTQTSPLTTLLRVDSDPSIGYEQIPEGVPGWYDWYSHAVIKDPADKGALAYAAPWGYIYNVRTGNPLPKDRVEVRDLQEWVLSKSTQAWTALYTKPEPIGGALYPDDFVTGSVVCAKLDTTTDPGSTISSPNVDCNGNPVTMHLWHLFGADANARVKLADPGDVAAITARFRVRLAETNPRSPLYPGYIACAGADWWSAPSGGTVNGAATGRCVTVKAEWRTVLVTTVPIGSILSTPPPVADNPAELY